MISTSFANSPEEQAGIISELMKNLFQNQLIIGDIHAPMNQISDIYKITDGDKIIGGWSIFKGFELSTVVIPPLLHETWEAIHSMVSLLDIREFFAPFPRFIDDKPVERLPWDNWNEFNAELQFTDIAMQLTKQELEVLDISHLPNIRAAKVEDANAISKYFDKVRENETFQGFWNPVQLETDIFVIAENEDQKIVGIGGAHFETPISVQIGNIHVNQEFRGIGLGKAITMACVLGVISTKRLPTLFVNENNKIAIDIYKDVGFEKYNEMSFYKLTRNQ